MNELKVLGRLAGGVGKDFKYSVKPVGWLSRWVLHFRFLKLVLLCLSVAFAYLLFSSWDGISLVRSYSDHAYAVAFVGGVLYSFGFTAPFGVGIFLAIAGSVNQYLAAVVAGLGSVLSDYLIFQFIRLSFSDEFGRVSRIRLARSVNKVFKNSVSPGLRTVVLVALSGIFIASPLPDEIGVALLAGFTQVEARTVMAISFLLNTAGILFFLTL